MATTTYSILKELREAIQKQYSEELQRFPITKKKREDLEAGFADGATNMIRHLVASGIIEILPVEDETADEPAPATAGEPRRRP